MVAAYLYVNAALYLTFAVWMTLSPWTTAKSVGYEVLSNSGRSEYLVIYGGLQLGLAAIYGLAAATSEWQRVGLTFSICLYAPIVLYRATTIVRFWPVENTTLIVGVLEIALLAVAIALKLAK